MMESEIEEGKRKTSAIIFGALSSIGKEVIYQLANVFDCLILTEQKDNYNTLLELEKNLSEEFKDCEVISFELDLRIVQDIRNVFTQLDKKNIVIQACVYVVGVNTTVAAIEVTETMWDQILDLNLKGYFFAIQQVGCHMIKNKGGSIVSIASQHGTVVNYNRAPYCASKAGLIHLSKALALEWGKYNIRVNVVSPTFVVNNKNKLILNSKENIRSYLKNIPLYRYATSNDVADAVCFLLSDKASMITGHDLLVDGGWTIK